MTLRPALLRWTPAARQRASTGAALLVMLVLASINGVPSGGVLALTVLAWVPLLVRHRLPEAALAGAVAADAVRLAFVPLQAPATFTVLPVATTVMVCTYAAVRRPAPAWTAGIGAALALLTVGLVRQDADRDAELMFMVDVVVGATAAGALARGRRLRLAAAERRAETAEQTRDEEAARQVLAERLRIARELHDVLAHHLTLVNAQAGVADYLLRSNPDKASEALRGITTHTRQALDEVRATIGLLRPDPATGDRPDADRARRPMPTAEDIDGLVEEFRRAGGAVTVTSTGVASALSPATGLAAYRIVQESLTNARKHAPGVPVRLDLRWTAARLEIEVSHRGPVTTGDGRAGHGLIGMRERALAAGGDLSAGPLPDGFLVRASLPVDAARTGETVGGAV